MRSLDKPSVEIAGDELRSLIDTDGLGIADGLADALQGQHDILASIAEARIDGWREPTEDIDDGQHAELATGRELVMNEVHRPGLIDLSCFRPVFA